MCEQLDICWYCSPVASSDQHYSDGSVVDGSARVTENVPSDNSGGDDSSVIDVAVVV